MEYTNKRTARYFGLENNSTRATLEHSMRKQFNSASQNSNLSN